ncbi:MAG TPA: MFS transporter [Chloroflexia bacterium]|nr:MFS transporter [Chloroflexia bacterium]
MQTGSRPRGRTRRASPLRIRGFRRAAAGSHVADPLSRGLGRLRRVRRAMASHLPSVPLIRQIGRRSASERVEGLSPEAALHASRNFRHGVWNGVAFTVVDSLIAPSLVLAWFINRLGAPNVLVGLLPAILSGGWFLPQMLVASRVQGLKFMMPRYTRVGIMRTITMGVIALCTVLLAPWPEIMLVVFFVLYTFYAFSAGFSGLPWLEVVGKVIAPRRRGSFFGMRNFWGGLLALAIAAPIGAVLSEQFLGLTFPYNFALLFGVATVCIGVGVWAWSSVHEPPALVTAPPLSVRDVVRRGVSAFQEDGDYRAFMIARILISLATVADPFYVVFAKTHLGAPPATVGLYLGAVAVSSLLSNFIWSPLSDRAGNRTLMVLTVCSVALVPATALVLSMFAGILPSEVLFTAFALVFIVSGLALGAARIINNNMLLTIAPKAQLGTYVGFLNTVLGIVIFVPVLGGLLADFVGYEALFALSMLLALSAFFSVRNMSPSSARP